MSPKVLLADDDPLICRILSIALQRAGFVPVVVNDGAEALRQLSREGGPRLALLDWVMPGLDGPEVCKQLRATEGGAGVYVFLVSSRQSEEDVLAGFEAGVDEFIAKPFEPQVVAARLTAAWRRLEAREGLTRLFQEACQGEGGEIILRSKEQQGRVLVFDRKIAWVQVSGGRSLVELLGGLGVSAEDTRLVLGECQSKKLPFKDTLIEWNLVQPDALRECFREEFSRRLAQIARLPGVHGFFVPSKNASFHSGFLYDLDELSPRTGSARMASQIGIQPRELGAAPTLSDSERAMLAEVCEVSGALGAAWVDLVSGVVLGQQGQPIDTNLLHQQARLFLVEDCEPIDEAMSFAASRYHVLRRMGPRLLCLAVDREANPNIALARMALAICAQRYPDE